MKLSDLFSITPLRHGRKRVDLLDEDGMMLLSATEDTAEKAMGLLLKAIRGVFRERNHEPLFLEYRGDKFIIYNTPDGWTYAPLKAWQDDECVFGVHSTCGGYASRKAAERAVRCHLAQRNWQPGEHEASIIAAWDTEGQRDFAIWTRFQDAYREALAKGLTGNDAHEYASMAH